MHPILQNILSGFMEIFTAPSKDWSVLWLLAPIFLFWFLIELYHDRHKHEKLGWNSAFGNGLSLFWVAIVCIKVIMGKPLSEWDPVKVFMIFLIFLYGLIIIFGAYTHKFPEKLEFFLAAPTPTYFNSAIAVLWAYNLLPINLWIILDLLILYWIILGLELLIRKYTPEAPHSNTD